MQNKKKKLKQRNHALKIKIGAALRQPKMVKQSINIVKKKPNMCQHHEFEIISKSSERVD